MYREIADRKYLKQTRITVKTLHAKLIKSYSARVVLGIRVNEKNIE